MIKINPVRTKDQANSVYTLAYEFIDWLRDRYPEMESEINTYLVHQQFDEQIRDVLIHFTPPKGECLLAVNDGVPIGILMLKNIGNETCEMNRMFVRDSARGLGVGRSLVANLKVRATEMGFQTMILSALPRHHEAISLYQASGFKLDNRVRKSGNSADAVLMKLDLGDFENVPNSKK